MTARKPAGSTRTNKMGYIMIKVVDHPHFGTRYVARSHVVFFDGSGHPAPRGFDIHHRDWNKTNDTFENLELLPHGEHASHHRKTGIPWNKGTKGLYSNEHREKLSDANRKRVWTQEAKAKVSEFARNRTDLSRDNKGRYNGSSG